MGNAGVCPVCCSETVAIGSKVGAYSGTRYDLRQCPTCRYSFVANPWTDYAAIYSADYYAGKGADPFVDYAFELAHPDRTVRRYEWAAIRQIVHALTPVTTGTRWLDYGCGNGALVREVRQRERCAIEGFEEGWICNQARRAGIPILTRDELDRRAGAFDVVTAIEVLEHAIDPLSVLRDVRRLLKPGGLLFFTTGNARPYRDRLLAWRYVVPEIHVGFFEPQTLARALTLTGFRPEFRGFLPGHAQMIRFKVLKSLRLREPSLPERLLWWPLVARIVDARLGVTALPIGWAT